MKKLFKKIFDDVITYEKDFIEMDAGINKEIEKHLTKYEEKMNNEEMENLKNLLYEIINISEREGFFLGLQYAARILSIKIFS